MPLYTHLLLAVGLLARASEQARVLRETTIEAGQSVLLSCVLDYGVEACQWSWQSLRDPDSHPIVVKQFPSFGDGKKDCSIRFTEVKTEQEGVWTCGARPAGQTGFTVSAPISLRIRRPITFTDVITNIEARIGKPVSLICKIKENIHECQWTWRSGKLSNETALAVKEFVTNTEGDCSIQLESVSIDQEGLWTCGARYMGDAEFTKAKDSNLTISKEMEFVQLSQDIQVNVGEPVLLHCVVNLPVEWCEWSWQPLGQPDAVSVVVKGFSPTEEQKRDCSVRFSSILEEQEGFWSCAVRHTAESPLNRAPPATLTLLPAVKIRFLETPADTRVALGRPVVLRCVAASAITNCTWKWHPRDNPNKQGVLVKQFVAFGNYSRDCSVHFKSVQPAQEGYWGCTVHGGPPEAMLMAETPLAKLTVYELVPIQFTELSKDIQIPPGNPLSLRCITSSSVEDCQWSWRALNHTNSSKNDIVISTFAALGNESQDCSMRLKAVSDQHEGIWTCSARRKGENEMTAASPARVVLLKPDSVMVALWAAPKQKVTLACRLSSPQPSLICHWYHPPDVVVNQDNQTERHSVQQNNNTGDCSLTLDPQPEDMGQWRCVFTMDADDGTWELASATLFLQDSAPVQDKTMDWLVGVLGGLVILLTLLLIGLLVCKCRPQDKTGLGNPTVSAPVQGEKDVSRYTENPSKINFQFGETTAKATPDTNSQQPDHHHIYEQVDRYISPTTSKSIYENVE